MSTDAQLLKAYGHLPTVELADLERLAIDVTGYDAVLQNRFCGCPDFPDEEIADADPADLQQSLGLDVDECFRLKRLHTRWLSTTGRGSWPSGCHGEYPQRHAVKYYVEYGTFPNHYTRTVADEELDRLAEAKVWGSLSEIKQRYAGEPMLKVALDLCERTYRRRGVAHLELSEGRGDQIHIKSKYIAGSTIGYAYFNDGTCSDHVTCNIDSSYKPGLHSCTTLIAHEVGHNNNLPHTFSGQSRHHGIMSYSPIYPYVGYSTGQAPYDRPKDPSIAQLDRQYGDEPFPDDGGPEPPAPQPSPISVTGKLTTDVPTAVRGELFVSASGRGRQRVIIVPDGSGGYKPVPRAS